VLTIPAKWFHEGRQGEQPRLIVIHCTVSPDSSGGAEAVARYFATGERKASAHRTVDSDSTVISVRDSDTAFAAAGANRDGLHLELVGMPTQTRGDWLDLFGQRMITRAGTTVREWSTEWHIPLRWLSVAQVADGRTRGLCTHHDVSRAFPAVSTGHWDPGPDFPKEWALDRWTPDTPTPPPEDDPVAKILQRTDGAAWWICDGITKRHLTDRAKVGALVFAGFAKWDDGKPFRSKAYDAILDDSVTVK
jgi:hypothetical protein